ncbi:helix-turn-helix domain-containing protein [Clostridium sp.]|uniref:helix-turn-helix domain-containing protein n=1 Tax=Clostridium sp. TaxID=1506 RepID=UPI0030784218
MKKGPIDLEQEVAALEKRYMSEALKLSGNNLTRAAALLGVTRFSMKRKMEREDGEK